MKAYIGIMEKKMENYYSIFPIRLLVDLQCKRDTVAAFKQCCYHDTVGMRLFAALQLQHVKII